MGNELKMDGEDWLDAKLRDEMPYIDDAGFTARVVQQMPVRKRASRKLRATVLLLATFIASVVAFVFAGPSVVSATAFLFALKPVTIAILAGCIVMLLTVLGGSYALTKARDPR
jgi:hypothetical protein